MGCLGIATYQVYRIFIRKQFRDYSTITSCCFPCTGMYRLKFILLTFLPAVIVWVFLANLDAIRSPVLKIMLAPFMISCAIALGYFAMVKAGEDNAKYSLQNVAMTAQDHSI